MENEKLENVDKAVISGTQRVSTLSVEMNQMVSFENNINFFEEILIFTWIPFSFASTAKGWVQPFNAMLRAARGSTTSPARQPVDPSSP